MRNAVLAIGLAFILAACTDTQSRNRSVEAVSAPSVQNAEQYYRQLLSRHGKRYEECLRNVNLKSAQALDPVKSRPTARNLIVAIDSSGSMAGNLGGRRKIDAAKAAVIGYLSTLPSDVNVGMVAFGHKGNNKASGRAMSCSSVEALYPLGQSDKAKLQTAAEGFQPNGWTPLASAIQTAGAQLLGRDPGDGINAVYVVSDGMETCDGDPAGAAAALHTSNVRTIVNIIGFNVNSAEQRRLREVARAGGGEYISAETGDDIRRALDNAANDARRGISTARNTATSGVNAAATNAALAVMNACFDARMAMESTGINAALGVDPKLTPATRAYVVKRLEERQDKLRSWVKRESQRLSSANTVSQGELERQLQEIERDFTSAGK